MESKFRNLEEASILEIERLKNKLQVQECSFQEMTQLKERNDEMQENFQAQKNKFQILIDTFEKDIQTI